MVWHSTRIKHAPAARPTPQQHQPKGTQHVQAISKEDKIKLEPSVATGYVDGSTPVVRLRTFFFIKKIDREVDVVESGSRMCLLVRHCSRLSKATRTHCPPLQIIMSRNQHGMRDRKDSSSTQPIKNVPPPEGWVTKGKENAGNMFWMSVASEYFTLPQALLAAGVCRAEI